MPAGDRHRSGAPAISIGPSSGSSATRLSAEATVRRWLGWFIVSIPGRIAHRAVPWPWDTAARRIGAGGLSDLRVPKSAGSSREASGSTMPRPQPPFLNGLVVRFLGSGLTQRPDSRASSATSLPRPESPSRCQGTSDNAPSPYRSGNDQGSVDLRFWDPEVQHCPCPHRWCIVCCHHRTGI
jgi:hypothetical protein